MGGGFRVRTFDAGAQGVSDGQTVLQKREPGARWRRQSGSVLLQLHSAAFSFQSPPRRARAEARPLSAPHGRHHASILRRPRPRSPACPSPDRPQGALLTQSSRPPPPSLLTAPPTPHRVQRQCLFLCAFIERTVATSDSVPEDAQQWDEYVCACFDVTPPSVPTRPCSPCGPNAN